MSERISGTSGEWQTITIRFRAPNDLAKPTGWGDVVATPIGRALMEMFDVESVDIDDVLLTAHRAWLTHPAPDESEQA